MGSQAALPHKPRSGKVGRENPGDVAGGAACVYSDQQADQRERRSEIFSELRYSCSSTLSIPDLRVVVICLQGMPSILGQ